MKGFFKMSFSGYLQYTRSYAFLITLAIALYASYTFVPPPNASYVTLRIGNYIGVMNSAWCGFVTAMMTSLFLSLAGFFLINGNIKKDIDTGVGVIIAASPIGNLKYLLSKACTNFLVLSSIMVIVMLMSMAVFLIRAGNYPFEPLQFISPFIIITLPAIFFISALAVVAEVGAYKYPLLLNIGFFILLMGLIAKQASEPPAADLYGVRAVTLAMQHSVSKNGAASNANVNMGFLFGSKDTFHTFVFDGLQWPASFLISRLLWMALSIVLIFISSRFFHRFDISPPEKKTGKNQPVSSTAIAPPTKDIRLSDLPAININYHIWPLIQTELLLLFRKGPKWLWLINFAAMVAMVFSPVAIAHQFILPALWFLQIGRWSDLSTKEKSSHVHYFSYAAYRPLARLFTAQLLAGILLGLFLALPLLIRFGISLQLFPIATIVTGAAFIVLIAALTGIMTGGKKLFEILYFLCFYANMNKVPFTDYYGAENHSQHYLITMLATSLCLAVLSFGGRKLEMRRL